eukprot:GFKZ01013324.1.p1 GENE.GFKZ01013324.1~~GFKZ01013324.1.p1  ORF type:complete len:491 (+),score=34.52 GFKZ01013324.1:116-1474(+)
MGSTLAATPGPHFHSLHAKLSAKTAVIGIIGLGYVGLPLANTLHTSGFTVVGYDTDVTKIHKLQRGESYIHHINAQIARCLSQSPRFSAVNEISALSACDVLVLCVPTPVGPHNEPDMTFVTGCTRQVAGVMRGGALVVLESTTYPGATDGDLVGVLAGFGKRVGEECYLAYSPEREDPGNTRFKTHEIPKLVGGVDEASGVLAELFYTRGGFERTVRVSSARVAECAKLVENSYRAVNIALVNELKVVFESMGVDVWEVLAAAGTKPFGFQRFDPGPGIGGHCIPVDPFYLTWKAKETGAPCGFIELAAMVNAQMPGRVVGRVQQALNDECKSVKGSRILLLGIAYKANVDDIREAPGLVIWERLLDLGAVVRYYDPFVRSVCETRKHARLWKEESVEMEGSVRGLGYDAVVVVTNHKCFEGYCFLQGFEGPVVDTRNAIDRDMGLKVVRA